MGVPGVRGATLPACIIISGVCFIVSHMTHSSGALTFDCKLDDL